MTPQQLITLKALALADNEALSYLTNGNDTQLQDWFNTETTFVVWRSVLTPRMSREAIVEGAIELNNLTPVSQSGLLYLCEGDLPVYKSSVRKAIVDLCGNQNTLKAALAAASKRFANRAEKALATGDGTNANPALLTWEGSISGMLVSEIRNA